MTTHSRRASLLGLFGLAGSLLWLSLTTVLSPDWGPPGSANYLGYETINRLWAPAFAGLLCGFVGLALRFGLTGTRPGRLGLRLAVIGLVVMILGNIAEFWFLTRLPYGELNLRALAWISVLLGMLSLLIGAALLGLAGRRQRLLPMWASPLLMLALPLFLVLVFAQLINVAWLVLGALGLTAGALALWPHRALVAAQGVR
jgi:hypothetical protein